MTKKTRLFYLIKQLQAATRSHLERRVREHDMTLAQYMVMSRLAAKAPASSAALARFHWVAPQTMNEIVATLERRGLIVRSEDPNNARTLLISLTKEGRSLLDEAEEEVDELEAEFFGSLTPSEYQSLTRMLTKLTIDIGRPESSAERRENTGSQDPRPPH